MIKDRNYVEYGVVESSESNDWDMRIHDRRVTGIEPDRGERVFIEIIKLNPSTGALEDNVMLHAELPGRIRSSTDTQNRRSRIFMYCENHYYYANLITEDPSSVTPYRSIVHVIGEYMPGDYRVFHGVLQVWRATNAPKWVLTQLPSGW